jgi:transposase
VSDAAALPKAGNRAARRLLIEAAWSYRFPARLSRELLLRQELNLIYAGAKYIGIAYIMAVAF